jgi:hypothetical protein
MRLLSWLLVSALVALAILATLDAFLAESEQSTDDRDATTSEPRTPIVFPASSPPPPCRHEQLALSLEMLGGAPAVVLKHVRGRPCHLRPRRVKLTVTNRFGKRERRFELFAAPFGNRLTGDLVRDSALAAQPPNLTVFDWCAKRGPFILSARVGSYSARFRVPCSR